MSYAWTVTNALASLAAGAFTWASGPSDATRLYMRDRRMGKQFVCTSSSGGNTLNIDFGTATALRGFGFLNHNLAALTGTVSCQIQGADDAGFTTGVVTAKNITTLDFTFPHNKDFVLQFGSISKRYWRLVFTWTGAFVLKVGEVFAYASATGLSRKDIYGNSADVFEQRSARLESDNLEVRAYLMAGPRRTKRMVFQDLSQSEVNELLAMWRATLGPVNPVLFITEVNEVVTAATAAEQDVLFGKLDLDTFEISFPDFSRNQPPTLSLRNLAREVGA